MLGGDVFGSYAIDSDIVEAHANLVLRVDTQHGNVPRRHATDILQQDVAIDRNPLAREDGVHGVQHYGVGHVFHTDVLVRDVFNQPAAAAIGFDADAVVGAFQAEAGDLDMIHSPGRTAADRHAVTGIEMVIGDGDMRCSPRCTGL